MRKRLAIVQVITLSNARRKYEVTMARASKLANDAASTAEVKYLLQNMATVVQTEYKFYTDNVSNVDMIILSQEIHLTDDRRKFQTRLKEIAETGSETAIETFIENTPEGCVASAEWNYSFQTVWSGGSEHYEIMSE